MFDCFDALGIGLPLRIVSICLIFGLFVAQYVVCVKAKRRMVRWLPAIYIVLILITAYICVTRNIMKLGLMIGWILCFYAKENLLASVCAWLLAWLIVLRKRKTVPETKKVCLFNSTTRKKFVLGTSIILCLALAVSIKLTVGYHPYKNLDFADVSRVEITFGAKEPHSLNRIESEQIIDALKEITIYRKLLYQVGVEGTIPEMFILHYKNGKSEVVAANGKDFMIDYVAYRSNYEKTQTLDQLWSEFLGRYY